MQPVRDIIREVGPQSGVLLPHQLDDRILHPLDGLLAAVVDQLEPDGAERFVQLLSPLGSQFCGQHGFAENDRRGLDPRLPQNIAHDQNTAGTNHILNEEFHRQRKEFVGDKDTIKPSAKANFICILPRPSI